VFGVSTANARKIIQRAVQHEIIKSSKPFSIVSGQYIYYSNNTYISRDGIKKVCKEFSSPTYRLLELLNLNGGIISYYEAQKVVGAPIKNSSTKEKSLTKIVKELRSLDLVNLVDDSNSNKFVIHKELESNKEELIREHSSKMYIDAILLSDIFFWLKRRNIIDNKNYRYRNKNLTGMGVLHNNLVWDGFAYTSTTGLHTENFKEKNSKKTLVVLDVVVNREYHDIDLKGFLNRIDIIRCSVKSGIRKIMPIIVSRNLSSGITTQIVKLGIIHLDLASIYGENIFGILDRLKLIKEAEIFRSPEKGHFLDNVERALDSIKNSGQDINLENLKGDFFEMIIFSYLISAFPNSTILHGIRLKNKELNKEYEYDFIVDNHRKNEVVIVEVKGYKSSSKIKLGDFKTKSTVKWFFGNTFPFAKKNFKSHQENTQFKACYITSAEFSEEAQQFMEGLTRTKIRSSALNIYYDGKSIRKTMKEEGYEKGSSLINQYY
jgi:hypothetical protein